MSLITLLILGCLAVILIAVGLDYLNLKSEAIRSQEKALHWSKCSSVLAIDIEGWHKISHCLLTENRCMDEKMKMLENYRKISEKRNKDLQLKINEFIKLNKPKK